MNRGRGHPPCPLEHHQHLEQQGQPGRQHDLVAADDLGHFVQGRREVEIAEADVAVVGDEIGHLQPQGRVVQPDRHGPQPHDDRGQLLRVLGEDGQQQVFDRLAQQFVDPADHAEVDQPDRVVGQQDQIARVRIGVIKAVGENHLQKQIGSLAGDLVHVEIVRAGSERRRRI